MSLQPEPVANPGLRTNKPTQELAVGKQDIKWQGAHVTWHQGSLTYGVSVSQQHKPASCAEQAPCWGTPPPPPLLLLTQNGIAQISNTCYEHPALTALR